MDALVIVCSWNTNGYYGLSMDALVIVCSWNKNVIMAWAWMLLSSDALEDERYYGLGIVTEHDCYYG